MSLEPFTKYIKNLVQALMSIATKKDWKCSCQSKVYLSNAKKLFILYIMA